MRETRYVRHLSHEPAVVSDFLADLCNDGKWRKEVLHTDLVSGRRGGAGAKYRETLTWEGLHAPASLTVAEMLRGSRLVVVAEDPGYKAVYEYDFTESAGGTEDFACSPPSRTSGPVQLIEPFMWSLVTRWLERDFDGLDAVLAQEQGKPE